jgi:protein involved in polysaccharide export with SLBB domain
MKKKLMIWHVVASLSVFAQGALSLKAADDETDRKIQAGDTIVIEVFGEEKLTVTRRVQGSGTIVYPLLNEVQVADQTTAQVASVLKKRLGQRFVRNPQVSVMVKEYRSRTVTVHGCIDFRGVNGGSVELPSEQSMDLLEALAKAGGFSAKAGKNPRIELTRKSTGKVSHYRFDDLRRETDPSKKVWLEPGDIIYVPEPFF